MGRFATVPLSSLRPTQDYLFSEAVERYAREIGSGASIVLSVREPLENGEPLEIIDGHHAAAALYTSGADTAHVWVAQGPNDVPSHADLTGSIQYSKYDDVCTQIGRRHMASFGYVPTIDGQEITSLDAFVRMAADRNPLA